jgi:ankyrin repeat protein
MDLQPRNYALIKASGNGHNEVVKTLKSEGADVNVEDTYGNFPLLLAVRFNRIEVVKALIDLGADINKNNRHGEFPLLLAARFNRIEVVKALIDLGADINQIAPYGEYPIKGNYPLFIAANYGHYEVVKRLLDAGADLHIKIGEFDILTYAEKKYFSPDINLLILSRAKPDLSELSQKIYININKTVPFSDPIMLSNEDIHIETFIKENINNIVIVYDKNRYFFTNRDLINSQKNDATIYPCIEPDTMRRDNIIETKPLYDLKKIGFVAGYPCVMDIIFNNPKKQLFAIINTNETYPSFVSHNNYVSGLLHCQAGQQSKISYMILAYQSTSDNLAYPSTSDNLKSDIEQLSGKKRQRAGGKGKKTLKNKKTRKTLKNKKTRKTLKNKKI